MRETILKRALGLLSVKSIVTLALTGAFLYLACVDGISQDFMMIYTVVIAFYFGTQSQKEERRREAEAGEMTSCPVLEQEDGSEEIVVKGFGGEAER